jgi:hypothetical protein
VARSSKQRSLNPARLSREERRERFVDAMIGAAHVDDERLDTLRQAVGWTEARRQEARRLELSVALDAIERGHRSSLRATDLRRRLERFGGPVPFKLPE